VISRQGGGRPIFARTVELPLALGAARRQSSLLHGAKAEINLVSAVLLAPAAQLYDGSTARAIPLKKGDNREALLTVRSGRFSRRAGIPARSCRPLTFPPPRSSCLRASGLMDNIWHAHWKDRLVPLCLVSWFEPTPIYHAPEPAAVIGVCRSFENPLARFLVTVKGAVPSCADLFDPVRGRMRGHCRRSPFWVAALRRGIPLYRAAGRRVWPPRRSWAPKKALVDGAVASR